MLQREIGIDLGTVNVLVYVRGAGIVLQEPSVVALTVNESRIVAVGEEAKSMLGRTPDAIEVVRPMRDGVIADYQITEAMLRYFIKKATGGVRIIKPKVMISVPFGVTSVESRAVHEAAVAAGGGHQRRLQRVGSTRRLPPGVRARAPCRLGPPALGASLGCRPMVG